MSSKSAFLRLLFDPGQQTCFSSTAKGTQVRKYAREEDVFFCINALDPSTDQNPTLEYHAPNKPRRADHNVVCFRNFLVEIDNMPLDAQLELIKKRGLPISACTYSGSKSNHFIISLEEPLSSASEYRTLARQIHALVPESDPTQKNPSRLSRLPFAFRKDTSKVQKLLYLGSRIKLADLLEVLPEVSEEHYVASGVSINPRFIAVEVLEFCYEPDEVMERMSIQGRNHAFFYLGKRLEDLGYDLETRRSLVERAYTNLKHKKDFSFAEALQAARV